MRADHPVRHVSDIMEDKNVETDGSAARSGAGHKRRADSDDEVGIVEGLAPPRIQQMNFASQTVPGRLWYDDIKPNHGSPQWNVG